MKFGHEYEQALANEGFPRRWLGSAIDYKFLKKCIKKVHRELTSLGLDQDTLTRLTTSVDPGSPHPSEHHEYFSAVEPTLSTIPEEFTPQLRVLVDGRTGNPLDAKLAPETRDALAELAKHLIVPEREQSQHHVHHKDSDTPSLSVQPPDRRVSTGTDVPEGAKWVQIPLASAQNFFNLLEPKLQELEVLREAETRHLEEDVLDLGEAVEDVVEPVREGFEARRKVSYRDLYFWREMFRLYMETPIFYSETEGNRGALTFAEAKKRLEAYDQQLRATGLLEKLKTPEAQQAAKKFFGLNVDILQIMHFQEMNAQAMTKILKKFDKHTHLEAQMFLKSLRAKHPLLLPTNGKMIEAGGFANSIAKDINAEITSKLLQIVPQPGNWDCPVCGELAWRPVDLGCCRARFCIRCVIKMQDDKIARCPCCNSETVLQADGRNVDFEAMDFLEKYFPLEVKRRQKDNEKAQLQRQYGEDFTKPGCTLM